MIRSRRQKPYSGAASIGGVLSVRSYLELDTQQLLTDEDAPARRRVRDCSCSRQVVLGGSGFDGEERLVVRQRRLVRAERTGGARSAAAGPSTKSDDPRTRRVGVRRRREARGPAAQIGSSRTNRRNQIRRCGTMSKGTPSGCEKACRLICRQALIHEDSWRAQRAPGKTSMIRCSIR